MHSGASSTRGDEFPEDDQQDRRHGRPRHPREPGPTARTATASRSPADTDDEGPLRPGGGRRRPRAAGRRGGLRLGGRGREGKENAGHPTRPKILIPLFFLKKKK